MVTFMLWTMGTNKDGASKQMGQPSPSMSCATATWQAHMGLYYDYVNHLIPSKCQELPLRMKEALYGAGHYQSSVKIYTCYVLGADQSHLTGEKAVTGS